VDVLEMSRRNSKDPAALTYKGVVYRSHLEVHTAKSLERYKSKRRKHPIEVGYECEGLPYVLAERIYVPDFKVTRSDGSVLYIEVKGYLDRDSIRKMLAVKECHPDKTFVFLFSKNNPIRKGAKMRYSDWCNKHGFDFAFEELPEEWFNASL
jgi:predicted nuclease of restriction endonuclease-like RecB superfamily